MRFMVYASFFSDGTAGLAGSGQARNLTAVDGLALADCRGNAMTVRRAHVRAGAALHTVHDGELVERDHVMAAGGAVERKGDSDSGQARTQHSTVQQRSVTLFPGWDTPHVCRTIPDGGSNADSDRIL